MFIFNVHGTTEQNDFRALEGARLSIDKDDPSITIIGRRYGAGILYRMPKKSVLN
jgi:hypothetical protein